MIAKNANGLPLLFTRTLCNNRFKVILPERELPRPLDRPLRDRLTVLKGVLAFVVKDEPHVRLVINNSTKQSF